uniref:Uncharacterized protein n=1 Tax=Timema genevievae TaxID=629358 RepID=A0A7R9PQ44_TIMGE|nr:unnamed protein product [Timema genevievae]
MHPTRSYYFSTRSNISHIFVVNQKTLQYCPVDNHLVMCDNPDLWFTLCCLCCDCGLRFGQVYGKNHPSKAETQPPPVISAQPSPPPDYDPTTVDSSGSRQTDTPIAHGELNPPLFMHTSGAIHDLAHALLTVQTSTGALRRLHRTSVEPGPEGQEPIRSVHAVRKFIALTVAPIDGIYPHYLISHSVISLQTLSWVRAEGRDVRATTDMRLTSANVAPGNSSLAEPDPWTNFSNEDSSGEDNDDGFGGSTVDIIILVIGSAVIVLFMVGMCYTCYKMRNRQRQRDRDNARTRFRSTVAVIQVSRSPPVMEQVPNPSAPPVEPVRGVPPPYSPPPGRTITQSSVDKTRGQDCVVFYVLDNTI